MHVNPGGHEQRDVNTSAVTRFGVVLAFATIAVLLLMWLLFDAFAKREARSSAQPAPLAAAGAQPPEPRLQASPIQDLKTVRAEEDAVLKTYGWVDQEKGIVRIPVSEAMRLMGKK